MSWDRIFLAVFLGVPVFVAGLIFWVGVIEWIAVEAGLAPRVTILPSLIGYVATYSTKDEPYVAKGMMRQPSAKACVQDCAALEKRCLMQNRHVDADLIKPVCARTAQTCINANCKMDMSDIDDAASRL
jgi:hypothetical protein